LRQASGHVQVGLLGGGELFSIEVHDFSFGKFCCNAAIGTAWVGHGKGKPEL
jgi:hypothetical protein